MRFLPPLVFVFGFSFLAFGQEVNLTGTVYDPSGSVVAGAQIKAIDEKGHSLSATSDFEGSFLLKLVPGIYAIDVSAPGFLTIKYNEYLVVNSTKGKMTMDFVMFGGKYHEPCGVGGADCLPSKSLIKEYQVNYSPKLKEIRSEFGRRSEQKNNTAVFTLTGNLFDGGSTTEVVPVVEIKATDSHDREFKTISRVNGSYELRMPFGQYKIEFSRNCFKKSIVRNFENASNLTSVLNINLERGHCNDCGWNICEEQRVILTGTVRDQFGVAIPIAMVNLRGTTTSGHKLVLNSKADDGGSYYFELPQGKYNIKARAAGHKAMKPKKFTIENAEKYEFDVELIAKPTTII